VDKKTLNNQSNSGKVSLGHKRGALGIASRCTLENLVGRQPPAGAESEQRLDSMRRLRGFDAHPFN
jgi:hypothetical protein